jgi:hypothetical protein
MVSVNDTLPPTSISKFQMTFEGDALRNNTIDAAILAESLYGVSSLLVDTNSKVNGSHSKMVVNIVGPFNRGSFDIDLVALMTLPVVNAIVNTVDLIALADVIVNQILKYIDFVKKTKGKPVIYLNEVDTDNCEVKIVGDASNNVIIVDKRTYNFYGDPEFKGNIRKTLSSVDHDGVDSVQIKTEDNAQTTVTKSELPYFDFDIPEPEHIETTKTQFLFITNSRLIGKSTGWRFRENEESKDFSALVVDRVFLNKVKSGVFAFSNGAYVEAVVKHIQTRTAREIKNKYIIIKVIDYKPRELPDGERVLPPE